MISFIMEPAQPEPNPRVGALLWNLPIDAATLEVVNALGQRGIGSMVLKGPALNDLYPADSARTYADGDLWVAPVATDQAGEILRRHGFELTKDEDGLPDWWLQHASEWRRERDGIRVDLHRWLQGVEIDPAAAWSLLWPRRVEFALAGSPAHRLPDDARALYVVLHATHHGIENPRSIMHLDAALSTLDDATWRSTLQLAGEMDALDGFATGIRLSSVGRELAARIGIPESRGVRTTLLATSPPPVALGFDQLAAARGLGRMEILLRKLVPPPGFVRHWWPPAARSRRMLVVGYLYRPVWLLNRAPAGYRAWRAARREASNSS